ncbi:MAG: hypothetical protein M2R45_00295 [Verrucomicrobia subdivision 3 bacterium]|nr:hypothetical protein [Limisphaerales bacterium]MCS1412945.1 hypothetical protein [Limisphaerales bacterium]
MYQTSFGHMNNREKQQGFNWDHGIKPKDTIHIATVAHVKVTNTFDKAFIAKNQERGNPLMTIKPS